MYVAHTDTPKDNKKKIKADLSWRKASVEERLSYSLKEGSRGTQSNTNPGGAYTGIYEEDWEWTDAGDLDECNGMTYKGQYGYYVFSYS